MSKRRVTWGSALFLGTAMLAAPGIAQQSDASINISDCCKATKLVRMVKPVYPPQAKADGISGKVRLDVVIAKDGKAKEVSVVSGEPVLADSAVAAVQQWEWEPVQADGKPIEVQQQVDVNFALPKKK